MASCDRPKALYGERPNGDTGEPVVSADGLVVAFTSDASNLVPGQTRMAGRPTSFYGVSMMRLSLASA